MKQRNTRAGKILRVKTGYNPNSSSVGSQIPAFLFSAVGTGIFAVIALQILNAIRGYIRRNKDSIHNGKKG